MIDRYRYREIMTNSLEKYSKLFRERNVNFIRQYETAKFGTPNSTQINNLTIYSHTWSVGDKYYKLASKFYGDPKDWWVIALFNNKPTESDVKLGDIILVPSPLVEVLSYFNV